MPTLNVVLTDHHAALLDRLVAGGRYQSASEVLREGLRLVESKEAEYEVRLKSLRDAARSGIADANAGRLGAVLDAVGLERHLEATADEAIAAAKRDDMECASRLPGALSLESLAGLVKGANTAGVRDRNDRY